MRFIIGWITGDAKLSDDEATLKFQQRYASALWFAIVPFLVFFGSIFIAAEGLFGEWMLATIGFFFFLIGFSYIIFYYRCPRCGTIPTSSKAGTSGILLFPKKCSKCGAPLLPNHRWGQD
jgi:hypothetical protein